MNKLKSRKFWAGLAGVVLPMATQAITGAVGWRNAVAAAVASLLGYILSQAYVDAANGKNGNNHGRQTP